MIATATANTDVQDRLAALRARVELGRDTSAARLATLKKDAPPSSALVPDDVRAGFQATDVADYAEVTPGSGLPAPRPSSDLKK